MKVNLALSNADFPQREASQLQATELPDDLRPWISEQMLVRLALEASQAIEWPNATSSPKSTSERTVPRPLLTTVLVYSYAAGVFGSRDIEILACHDPALRYLCQSTVPDREMLRLFRRQYVHGVTRSLEILLETVWMQTRSNGAAFATRNEACRAPSFNRWRAPGSEPDFAHEAEQRVARAIHADSMAMDE